MEDAKLLDEVIRKGLERLKEVEVGSEEYKAAVENVTKLIDRSIELDKVHSEQSDRKQTRDIENALKVQQMHEEKNDRLIGNILTAAGIIIPTAVTIWGTLASFKFEQEGTVTTIMGRGFVNKLLPKK